MRKKTTSTTKVAELPLESTATDTPATTPVVAATSAVNEADTTKVVANVPAAPILATDLATNPASSPEELAPSEEAQTAPMLAVVSAENPSSNKTKKTKLVRDSFTMPDKEYAQIDQIKKRLLTQGRAAKKSELLRAGLAQLMALDDAALLTALEQLEVIKTGRKAKNAK